MSWLCNRFNLAQDRPKVMAIVNLTESSFSGDGLYASPVDDVRNALTYAQKQLMAGADILDIGAESTRPGSKPVSATLEWQRLSAIIPELLTWNIPISIDTYKPETMVRVLDIGVDIINDINGFRAKDTAGSAWSIMSKYDAGAIVMHMQGEPATMQNSPHYDEVVGEVTDFFIQQKQVALELDIAFERLAFDPGFGFGKTLAHNLSLFKALPHFVAEHSPIVVGVSRKSMLGQITGLPVEERCLPSVVAAVLAIQQGAQVVRVHDVAATVAGIKVWQQITKP